MDELRGVEYLRKKLAGHRPRVLTRYRQYDMKYRDADIGLAIPPELRSRYRGTIGWSAKAVDALADRLVFREFANDNFNFNEIFRMNNPDTFFDSAITSALIASCCFIYISPGDEPIPRLQVIEGAEATGVIDPITGLLTEGYAVLRRDDQGSPMVEAYFYPGFPSPCVHLLTQKQEVTIKILHEYQALKCPRCRSELILISTDIDRTARQGREIRCPYCGARDLHESGQFDDLLNCLLSVPRRG